MTRQVIFEHHYGKPSAGRALGFVIHGIGAAIPRNQLRKPAAITGSGCRRYPVTCMDTLRDSLGIAPQPVATARILHHLCPLIYISAAVGDAVVLERISGVYSFIGVDMPHAVYTRLLFGHGE